jgi:hypothetical protein
MIPPPHPTRKRTASTNTLILSMKFPLSLGIGTGRPIPCGQRKCRSPKNRKFQIADSEDFLSASPLNPQRPVYRKIGNCAPTQLLKAKVTPHRYNPLLRKDVAEPRTAEITLRLFPQVIIFRGHTTHGHGSKTVTSHCLRFCKA